jgi:hypothetical protein
MVASPPRIVIINHRCLFLVSFFHSLREIDRVTLARIPQYIDASPHAESRNQVSDLWKDDGGFLEHEWIPQPPADCGDIISVHSYPTCIRALFALSVETSASSCTRSRQL